MKKFIFSLLFVVMLTGCSATVNMTIDTDKKVTEQIIVKEYASLVNTSSPNDYIDEALYSNFSKRELLAYTRNNLVNSDFIGVELDFEGNYDVCYSIKSSAFKYLSNDISCELKDDIYKISLTPDYLICKEGCFMPPDISRVAINISLPFEAISSNADSIKDNTYTWNFDGKDNEKMKISFKLKEDKKNNEEVGNDNNNNDNEILPILIVVIIALVLVVIGISLYGKYKSKKIQY